jgi:hypothetical protein
MVIGMASFHVYVEGAVDSSPDGMRRLAQAISQRYGLPAADLLTRLGAGRFRVKANVDKVTAEAYLRALEEVGARVTIEEALERAKSDVSGRVSSASTAPMNLRGSTTPPPRAQPSTAPATQRAQPSTPPTGSPVRASGSSTPPTGSPVRVSGSSTPPTGSPVRASGSSTAGSSLPPANAAARQGGSSLPPANRASTPALGAPQRGGASSLPPANAPKPATSPLQSGLSAAFNTRAQSESGFDALGGGALSLSSVDGNDDEGAPTGGSLPSTGGAFGPPPDGAPIAVSLAPDTPPPKTKPGKVASQPLDLFAPPDAEEAEAKVELATDEIEHRARKMSTPPVGVAVAAPSQSQPLASTPAMRRSNPSIQPPSLPASSADMPRGRFAAGVFLSILIGFIPAHLVAASRESTAFNTIDASVNATQNSVEDEDGYRALDGFRDAQLSKKKSERRTIAWQSMLIWAVLGAGAAYVYFRRIPWASRPDAT